MSRTRGRRTHVRSYVRRDGTRVRSYTQNRQPGRKRAGAVAAGAALLVLAGVAHGGIGGVASVSGTADDISVSAKTSRGGQTEASIKGVNDSYRATARLRTLGGHPTKLDAQSDKNCSDHSDGDLQRFFREHQCTSLYRTLIEYSEGKYVIRFLISTVDMPNRNTAKDLYGLLLRSDGGNISPLFPRNGGYHHVPFTSGPSKTNLLGTTVTNVRTQAVGSTPGTNVLASLATTVLSSLA